MRQLKTLMRAVTGRRRLKPLMQSITGCSKYSLEQIVSEANVRKVQ